MKPLLPPPPPPCYPCWLHAARLVQSVLGSTALCDGRSFRSDDYRGCCSSDLQGLCPNRAVVVPGFRIRGTTQEHALVCARPPVLCGRAPSRPPPKARGGGRADEGPPTRAGRGALGNAPEPGAVTAHPPRPCYAASACARR